MLKPKNSLQIIGARFRSLKRNTIVFHFRSHITHALCLTFVGDVFEEKKA